MTCLPPEAFHFHRQRIIVAVAVTIPVVVAVAIPPPCHRLFRHLADADADAPLRLGLISVLQDECLRPAVLT
jgi:hypothetical protein